MPSRIFEAIGHRRWNMAGTLAHAEREHRGIGRWIGPAEYRLHARDELAGRERLGDVVVGTDLQTGDTVDLLVARGEHDDGGAALGADPAAHLEPVDPGETDVEDDETDRVAWQLGEGVLSAPHVHDLEPVALEIRADQGRDALFVLDEEDGSVHRGHRTAGGGRDLEGGVHLAESFVVACKRRVTPM